MRDIFSNPRYKALQMIAEVGGVTMQNVAACFSKTRGRLRHPLRPFGADTDRVLAGLDLAPAKDNKE